MVEVGVHFSVFFICLLCFTGDLMLDVVTVDGMQVEELRHAAGFLVEEEEVSLHHVYPFLHPLFDAAG